jgi:hypothetical protein
MTIAGWKSLTVDILWLGSGAAAAALVLLASSCQLDRTGVGGPGISAKLTVDPELVCPGETTAVRWDLTTTLPRVSANCQRCTSSSSCSDGFTCIDNVCCRGPALSGGAACVVGGTCLPPSINMTLTPSDPAAPVPVLPAPLPLRSGVAEPVARTMDMTAAGPFGFPLGRIDDRAHVRVPVDPDDRVPMFLPFSCTGSGFGWAPYDFAVLGPTTSDRVRIRGILNISGRAVMLTGGVPTRGPVRVEAGEMTTAFDGLPVRGVWVAFIPADARIDLPTPICGAVMTTGRLPDISLSMRVGCPTP